MLCLSRKKNERVMIGDDIEIVVIEIRGGLKPRVRLGFQAPTNVPIHRQEVYDRIKRKQKGDET